MSRDPRVFEVVEQQAYEQDRDRIRTLSASLNGLSRLMDDHMRLYHLNQAESDIVRAELIKAMIDNHLSNLTDEKITSALDEIEAELESNDEE